MTPQQEKLADWLSQFEHITAVATMTLEINNQKYEAASYLARFNIDPSAPAYVRGKRHPYQCFIYCLGLLPTVYRRNTRIAFRMPDDPSDWFVASYWPVLKNHQQQAEPKNEHHPFGPSFMLTPWDAKDPIDHYEASPRRRYPIKIIKAQLLETQMP